MKLVTEIQDGMRFQGAEDSIDITSGEGLRNLIKVYRGLCLFLPWSELTREDTTMQTTSTGRTNWTTATTFLDVKLLEVQDGDDGNKYKSCWPFADYNGLNKSRLKNAQSIPDGYWRYHDGTNNRVELSPAPKYTGKTIRVTGIIEPAKLDDGNSRTIFITEAADDALEYMLAGLYQERDGFFDRAKANFKNAVDIFNRLFGREQVPEELIRRIIPPP